MAAALLALLSMVLAMAICPELHEIVHHDAHDHGHSCAVTLLLSGGTDAPQICSDIAPPYAPIFASEIIESSPWPSFFFSVYVLEHAPPVLS